MDVQIVGPRFRHLTSIGWATLITAAALFAPAPAIGLDGQETPEMAVKAALIYNFAKFTLWPALRRGEPLALCVVGDDGIAAALAETVRGKTIAAHSLSISQPRDTTAWSSCHILFVAGARIRKLGSGLMAIKTLPVLTISDGAGFAQAGNVIELYMENGRIRFAINVDAVERSGLQLSSRLLELAKVVRDPPVE